MVSFRQQNVYFANKKTTSSQTATSRILQWDQNTPHDQPNNSNGYLNEILKFTIL